MKIHLTSEELEKVLFEGMKAVYPHFVFCKSYIEYDVDEGNTKIAIDVKMDGDEGGMPSYEKRMQALEKLEAQRGNNPKPRHLEDGDKLSEESSDRFDSSMDFDLF